MLTCAAFVVASFARAVDVVDVEIEAVVAGVVAVVVAAAAFRIS